jgi:hypothetical protein
VIAARTLLPALLAAVFLTGHPASGAETGTALRFDDVGRARGLDAPTWCGSPEKPHLLESGGGGVAFFDYDRDGDLDLYFANAWRLNDPPDRLQIAERGRNLLYRNRGDGSFEDVSASAGVDDDGFGTGVAVGDVDRDGWPDLFISNFGPDVLYRNRGDGTFEVVDDGPSIDGWSTAAVIFDADGDGDEDLFLGGYIDCTLDDILTAEPELTWEGLKVMLGPFGLEGLGNEFFENLGNGRFERVTKARGLEDIGLFYTFAIAALDLDGDRDLDIYAANDSNPNYVYENAGDRFDEVGLWSGAALDVMGNAQAGMGLATGDLDNDGKVDLLVTNFSKDVSTFYRNLGDFLFEDKTVDLGIGQITYPSLSWGAELVDFDLDGDLDLFISNGHIYPQADRAPKAGVNFRQPNLLLENTGTSFVSAGPHAGGGLAVEESSRGVAAGDMDHDGDIDLALWNTDAPPTLLENTSTRHGNWLLVDAPAAVRVRAVTGEETRYRHRVIGGSYVSVDDHRLHFGLGQAETVDRLEIAWPDGTDTVLRGLPVNRVLRVTR